jgi:hypothetical protein
VLGEHRAEPVGAFAGAFRAQGVELLGELEQAAGAFAEVIDLHPRLGLEQQEPAGFFFLEIVAVAAEGDGEDAAWHQQRQPMAAQCGEHPGRCRAAGHLLSCVEV